LIAGCEVGDVVFRHPCAVHASHCVQDEEGRVRLSADLRFCREKDWDEGMGSLGWTVNDTLVGRILLEVYSSLPRV
jgi:hypothetical protein